MSFSSVLFKFVATIAIASSIVSGAPADNLQSQALSTHNSYRATHHVPGLRWSQALADHAASVSQTCVWEHSTLEGMGQNIGQGYESMADAVTDWYNEVQYYDYNTGDTTIVGEPVGHFTQVVWKDTTEIGCAVAYCENLNQRYFYVCDYSPWGNFNDNNAANVFRP